MKLGPDNTTLQIRISRQHYAGRFFCQRWVLTILMATPLALTSSKAISEPEVAFVASHYSVHSSAGEGEGESAPESELHYDPFALSNPLSQSSGISVMADLNNDGLLDVVFAHYDQTSDPQLSVLYNAGVANFSNPDTLVLDNKLAPGKVFAEDLDQDGFPEIIITNGSLANVSRRNHPSLGSHGFTVFYNQPGLPISAWPSKLFSGSERIAWATTFFADVDADGHKDIVTLPSSYAGDFNIIAGDGGGQFQLPRVFEVNVPRAYPWYRDFLTFDPARNGKGDIYLYDNGGYGSKSGDPINSRKIIRMPNLGRLKFGEPISIPTTVDGGSFDIVKLDDGSSFVIFGGVAKILASEPPQTTYVISVFELGESGLTPVREIDIGKMHGRIIARDIIGGSEPEIIFASCNYGSADKTRTFTDCEIGLLEGALGSSPVKHTIPVELPSDFAFYDRNIEVVDIDGNGKKDLAVSSSRGFSIFYNVSR